MRSGWLHFIRHSKDGIITQRMKITLVKKIMEDGQECRKCREVSDRLEAGNEHRFIDRTVYADLRDSESEGHKIAQEHGIDTAPFFVVEDDGRTSVYKTYMEFKTKVLKKRAEKADVEIEEKRQAEAEVDAIDFL